MPRLTKKTTLAIALIAALATPAFAQSTARASATLDIHTGPGSRYTIIGQLPKDARVPLDRCTRDQDWCRIPDAGWVRGGYLVGAAAKEAVTPFEFIGGPFAGCGIGPDIFARRDDDCDD